MDKYQQMTTQPVERLVLRLAFPTVTIMLISSLYNMADTYFVGKLGTVSVAAVGIAVSFMAVIQAVGFFFGQGAGNHISRALGARQHESAQQMASTALVCAGIAGLGIAVAGALFAEQIALLLGATPTILADAADYLRCVALGAPFICMSLMLNNILRFQGNAFYGMIGMVSGAVFNCVLDPLLIYGFNMGVKGAAGATAISQTVGFVLLLVGCRHGGNVSISLNALRFSGAFFAEIVRGGLPSLLRQGIASIGVLVLNRAAAPFGDAALAAIAIANRIVLLCGSALIGFGQGFQPVCGFNFGAKKYSRVRRAFWFCLLVAIGVLVLLSTLGSLFAPRIIALFRADDAEVVRLGAAFLRYQFLSLPLTAVIILTNMLLQTTRKSIRASILSAARQGLTLIPLALILSSQLGLFGLQIATPIADCVTFLIAVPLMVSGLKGKNDDTDTDGSAGDLDLRQSDFEA
ncbi:MAG: MATE family efflux transporter [Oscillospiraceae bacterium]|jgi:putative MATE family efflux protein|nr:MATE family efflux transporter [Oscillospiraceae bacterium]